MRSPRGRMALRSFCACMLLAASMGAHAAEPVAVDEGALALDQTVQSLKDEAIQFNRDARIAEETFLYPPQTRLAVYVSNGLGNLLLESIAVTVDNGAAVTYRYGDKDARALLEPGAMQRLLLSNVERGPHRLRVSYVGKFVDGDEELETVEGQYEAVFDKGLDAAEIELHIQRGPKRRTAAMTLKEWRAAGE
jgi:hypothetical protein